MIKIKVDRAEFDAAESNGYAYGRDLSKRSGISPWSVVIFLERRDHMLIGKAIQNQ
jgi:hypothetical protein